MSTVVSTEARIREIKVTADTITAYLVDGRVKASRNIGRRKWLVVIYKELSKHDGFVTTAYLLDRKPKGEVIWRQ